MKLTQSEHQIQNAILEYLAYLDVKAWRVNSGKWFVGDNNMKRVIMGAPTGTPDIIGVIGYSYGKHYGRMIAIEVKRPGGKPTDIQKRVMTELSDFGAYVFVAYSVNDVQEHMKQLKKEVIIK